MSAAEWSLPASLRALLVCPRCRGELTDHEQGLLCEADSLVYPVRGGVPWMIEERALRVERHEEES